MISPVLFLFSLSQTYHSHGCRIFHTHNGMKHGRAIVRSRKASKRAQQSGRDGEARGVLRAEKASRFERDRAKPLEYVSRTIYGLTCAC